MYKNNNLIKIKKEAYYKYLIGYHVRTSAS